MGEVALGPPLVMSHFLEYFVPPGHLLYSVGTQMAKWPKCDLPKA